MEQRDTARPSLGRRFAALAIDWTIATLTSGVVAPIISSALVPSSLRLGLFILEVWLLTTLTGSSMGQRLLGIRVVTWPDHYYAKPLPLLLRTFLIALVIPAVVYDSEGRGLHERLTSTTLIRIR